jgi:hypothetical protein
LLLLAACVPARVPEALTFTPGPPVIVTDRAVTTIAFRLWHPGGEWKIVTGEAAAPPSIYLVAPDGVAFIRVHVGPPDAADQPAPDQRVERREFTLADGTPIVALLSAPAADWAAMQAVFEQVVESVEPSQS